MDIAGNKNRITVPGRQLMMTMAVMTGLSMVMLHGTPMPFGKSES